MRELERVYEETRDRIVDLVAGCDDRQSFTTVPATPEWSVRDVVAHLSGLCADVLNGNVAGAATAQWTQSQVDARRGSSLADLLGEWSVVGPKIAAIADDFPGRYGPQLVTDISVHEQDLRGTLGRPGARDSAGIAIGLQFLVSTFVQPGASALGLDPLVIRADGRSWIVGCGPSRRGNPEEAIAEALMSADPSPIPEVPPVGTLKVDPYELFRAVTGRRSSSQIVRYDWTADPAPYLPVFELAHFSMREADLLE
jgi:uncharacterized protein (TIGR03083 family)